MSDIERTIPKAKILIDRMENITDHIELIGNIGAGKSLFLDRINHYLKHTGLLASTTSAVFQPPLGTPGDDLLVTLHEPSDDWSQPIHNNMKHGDTINESENKSLLQLFYDDPEKNGFLFQVNAFTSRLAKIKDLLGELDFNAFPSSKRIHLLTERSLRSDRMFFKNLYHGGVVRNCEWNIYESFFNLICEESLRKSQIMVYLRVSPEVCFERVEKRARCGEINTKKEGDDDGVRGDKGIIPNYLIDLHKQHEDMVKEFQSESEGNKVFIVEYNSHRSMEEIDQCVKETMESLLDYLQTKHSKSESVSEVKKRKRSEEEEHHEDETFILKHKRVKYNASAMTFTPSRAIINQCWECELSLYDKGEIFPHDEKVLCQSCLDLYYTD